MSMSRKALLLGVLLTLAVTAPAQYVWTGIGNGWRDQLVPPNDGTADLIIGSALRDVLTLPGNFTVNSVLMSGEDTFYVSGPAGVVLTINSGATITGFGYLTLDENVVLNLTGSPVFDAGGSRFIVRGAITGNPTNVTLTSSGTGGNFNFNSTASVST